MFKRPAYVSIVVGFISIYAAVMMMVSLRQVFLSGESDVPKPVPAVVSPEKAAADAAAAAEEAAKPIPTKAMPFIVLVYSIIAFVCMVNMLDGANWARWLYTVAFLVMLICDILDYSSHFLPVLANLVVRGIVIPFLFLPGANDFFRSES